MRSVCIGGFSIILIVLLIFQSAGAIPVSDETSIEFARIDETGPEGYEGEPATEPFAVRKDIVQNKPFYEKLAENRRIVSMMDPNIPMPDYDYDDIILKHDDPLKLPFSGAGYDVASGYHDRLTVNRFAPQNMEKRSPVTRSAAADLEITQLEWDTRVNPGWCSRTEDKYAPGINPRIGAFMVGMKTRINATVVNHDPTIPVTGIYMNFTILDHYSSIPLIRIPAQVKFSILGSTAVVSFDFVPPAAKTLAVYAYIDYPQDADPSNNGISYYPVTVLIWTSDFEPGGFGHGSQGDETWGGNISTGMNQWHQTTTAENQLSADHTPSYSYYHGDETGDSDVYDDDVNLFMESPKIEMGAISDGQADCGILPAGHFYDFAVPSWAGLFTGEAEVPAGGATPANTDLLWCYQYTDDGGANWKDPLSALQYGGFIFGNWETPFIGQTVPTWNPNIRRYSQTTFTYGWPFNQFISDGLGGMQQSNGAMNWSKVQFRVQFDGDSQSDSGTLPGYYADDFVTWGYQKWLPPYNIHLTGVSTLTIQSGSTSLPVIYPNVGTEFEVEVVNAGEPIINVPVKVIIKDARTGSVVHGPVTKLITSLAKSEKATVTWDSWTPVSEGDYHISVEVGDLTRDYTPLLNTWETKVYVRAPGGRVLVVDDDNGRHNGGSIIEKDPYFVDVEGRMLDALDDIGMTYNVYTVESNTVGPSSTVMNEYEAVIWLTGLDNEYSHFKTNPNERSWGITFMPEDQTEIAGLLDYGKSRNLWAISPGVLYDLTNTADAYAPTGFLKDYFHLLYCNANETEYNENGDVTKRGTPRKLVGDVNSLAAGTEYDTYADKPPPGFADIGGMIDSDSKSKKIFFQNTARTNHNSLQYADNYNLVYFGFNYYLIEDRNDRMDLAYRVMRFFGLMGAVDVELEDQMSKYISFDQTVSFKFKVTNPGLLQETFLLKLETPAPPAIPDGWTVILNRMAPSSSYNQLIVPGDGGTKPFYLNVTAPDDYLDSSGNINPSIDNTSSGSEIQFKIRVEAVDHPDTIYDRGFCKVIMAPEGYIQLYEDKTEAEVDLSRTFDLDEYYAKYTFRLRYVTNNEKDTNVVVALSNPTPLHAEIYLGPSVVTNEVLTLPPNLDLELGIKVTPDRYTRFGEYVITFSVLDAETQFEWARTNLTTEVKQYYDIRLTPMEYKNYSRAINPNLMTTDPQTEEFFLVLANYGNGPDTISLEWVENRDSPNPVPLGWEHDLVQIDVYDGGEDDVDEVLLYEYQELLDIPFMTRLLITVSIPKEEQEGRYWIDIQARSSAPREYINNLERDEFETEVNYTLQIQLVLPELTFDTEESSLRLGDGTRYNDQAHTVYAGDTIIIYMVIENEGTGGAYDVEVLLEVTLDNVPYYSDSWTITLGPGESRVVTFNVYLDLEGLYYFRVRIDPENRILGDGPNDNTWNMYLKVEDWRNRPDEPPDPPPDWNGSYTGKNRTGSGDGDDWLLDEVTSNPASFAVALALFIAILVVLFLILFLIVIRPMRERAALAAAAAASEEELQPPPPAEPVSRKVGRSGSPISEGQVTPVVWDDGLGGRGGPPYTIPPPPFSHQDMSEPKEVTFEVLPPEESFADEPLIFDAEVECPSCGGENPAQIRQCQFCGKEVYYSK